MTEITKDIRKTFFEIKRTYGKVSIPWVQFKFHVTYEEAENMIGTVRNYRTTGKS